MTGASTGGRFGGAETVSFELFGWPFALRTRSAAARRWICALYREFASSLPSAAARTFVLERSRGGRRRRGWRLTLDRDVLREDASLEGALGALEFEISMRAAATRPELMPIHGATIVGEWCALICGDSGAGKTTLSLALAARGYRVGSDDAALFDPRTGCVLPLPRCFHIDVRARRLLRRNGVALGRRGRSFLTPAEIGGGGVPPVYPNVLLVLEPGSGSGRPRLIPITQAEMTVRILQHVAWGALTPVDALRSLGGLVSGATPYLLRRGTLGDTASVVGELLGAACGERRVPARAAAGSAPLRADLALGQDPGAGRVVGDDLEEGPALGARFVPAVGEREALDQ